MKLSNLSVLAILSLTSATLYPDTETTVRCSDTNQLGQDVVKSKLGEMCDVLVGSHNQLVGKGGCMDLGFDAYEYYVYNINNVDGARTLDKATCTRFFKDVLNCPRGGQMTTGRTQWHFRGIPRTEKCQENLPQPN
ncbi:hypothetical protein DSL72_003650 [Monilinia vaccinii-corymbosi]|uniref:Secreted protein n=1 Tax=Monilinia vaccinii-corymbosi TaxID=61207 RepID=A0A8A3P854_9HELO|nr:hypothetical protein DSL72_003650 [Monilinia vaccinii-corymbosi]